MTGGAAGTVTLLLVLAMSLGCGKRPAESESDKGPAGGSAVTELAVCNGDSRDVFVFRYDTSLSPGENAKHLQIDKAVWHWHPDTSDLPREMRSVFRGLDECKPVMGLRYFLVTSSGSRGGMALIRRKDAKTLYCATGLPGAHSAEVLPDGNIVVACSGDKGFLRIFRVDQAGLAAGKLQEPRAAATDVPLPWGHGVVWDRKRKCLWALGGGEILQLTYANENGKAALTVASRVALPENGGHDLFPMVGGKDLLMVSTFTRNWLFSPGDRTFSEFSRMRRGAVKSMGCLASCDLLVAVVGEKDDHGESLIFAGPDGAETRVPVPGATFYKARWCVPNDFSY